MHRASRLCNVSSRPFGVMGRHTGGVASEEGMG